MAVTAHAPGAIHAALAGAPGAPVFFPYVWELAADRGGLTVQDLLSSASRCVAAVTDASRLLESDAVFVDCLPGSPAVEVVSRLSEMRLGKDVAACVAGPQRLLEDGVHHDVDDACDATEDLAREVLEAGCSVLVLDESAGVLSDSPPLYRVLAKLCAYYGARSLALAPADVADALREAGVDGVDCGPVATKRQVQVAPAARGVVPEARIITSSFAPRPRGTDADWLMAVGRQLREKRERRERTVEA
jgi:hypothetical protein